MEERQPGHTTVAFLAAQRLDHLDHVGGQVQVRDLHACRDAGRAGGVLQIGDGVGSDIDLLPGGTDLVGYGVDRDHAGTLLGRPAAEELPHPLRRLGGGQDRRRVAVVEDGVQAPDVAGLARVEQRHGDPAGVERAEEGDEILQVLRAEDRNAVAGLGHLLQAGADGAVACAEVGPVQIPCDAVALGRVVQESVGELVSTHLRPSFDVADQAAVVGKPDQSVFDERVMEPHLTLLSKPHSSRNTFSRGPSGRRGARLVVRRGVAYGDSLTRSPVHGDRQDFSPSRQSSVLVFS